MSHQHHIFLHVILFGIWFGSLLATLVVLGRLYRNEDMASRTSLLTSLRLVERVPKTAFLLMLPMGLQLSSNLGLITLQAGTTFGAWAFALVWLAISWSGARHQHGSTARAARVVTIILQVSFVLVVGGAGILSLLSQSPIPQPWLAAKMVLYASTLIVMMLYDAALMPLYPRAHGPEGVSTVPEDTAVVRRACFLGGLAISVLLFILARASWVGVTAPAS